MLNYAEQEQTALIRIARERDARAAYLIAFVQMKHPNQAEVIEAHALGVDLERSES